MSHDMDHAQVIEKLNAILRYEWTGLAQYAHYSYVVHGVWREVYSKMFHESAKECFEHADRVADKIVAMGGVPAVERDKLQLTDDLNEMLQQALKFESGAVTHYKEALALVGEGDRALTVLLEDILLEEQDGVDHVSKIVREHAAGAGHATKGKTKTA